MCLKGDNLYGMSNPISWGKKEKKCQQFLLYDFAKRVIKVDTEIFDLHIRKYTFWHVHLTKIQIILCIRESDQSLCCPHEET